MRAGLKTLIVVVLVAAAGFLVYRTFQSYSLDDVVTALTSIAWSHLALAGLFAASSYLCLTGFEVIGVRYAGCQLPYRKIALTSFVSLSIGHSLGVAALSSGAIRYRFYSRWGLGLGDVAKIVIAAGLTVSLGLVLLAGIAFVAAPELAAEQLKLSLNQARIAGVICIGVAAAYLLATALVRRPLGYGRWSIRLPAFHLALRQAVLGPLNFALVAACLHQLVAALADASYFAVAAVYVIAAASALISHVPGGLGVIESVVVFLLPRAEVLGAVVAFRVIYFLIPLLIGGTILALIELGVLGRRDATNPASAGAAG